MRAAEDRSQIARAQSDQFRRELAESEREVQSQQAKIQQAESSLYGGGVRNPKELEDLQRDIASLRRHLTTLEERQLESMANAENSDAVLLAVDADLQVLDARLGDQHRQLIEEQASLTKDVQRLDAERQAVVSALAKQALEVYENLRVQRRGVAVAEVSDDTCTACGTILSAALQQNARSATAIANCPSCGRILYAD